MTTYIKKGGPGMLLMAMLLALSGCGTTDPADKETASKIAPLVLSPASPRSDSQKLQALRLIMLDQTRAMAAYSAVRDQQGELYYTAVAAIEEGLRLGAPIGSQVLLEHWRAASHAFQQIDLALTQLQNASAAYHPAIEEAEVLRAPFAATLRARQDTAMDELQRQKGLMKFENRKMAVLRQAIAQGPTPPPPLQPTFAAKDEISLSEEPADEPAAMADEPEMDATDALPQEITQEITQQTNVAAVPPLVVIRFNRPNIVFRAQLQDAVQRAKALSSENQIRLVAVAPQRKTGQKQLLAQAESHQYAQSILRAVLALGVPPENVRITSQTLKTAASSEVHIYADE